MAVLLLGAGLFDIAAAAEDVFVKSDATRAILRRARTQATTTRIDNEAAVAAAESVIRRNEQLNNVDPATLRAAVTLSRRAARDSADVATPPASEPAPQPAPEPSGSAVASAAADAKLKVGEARILTLPATTESEFRSFIGEQLSFNNSGAIAVLPGAVETLAVDESSVILKAFAFNSQPLKFNPQTRHFEGRVSVGVVSLQNGGVMRQLAAPITFQLFGPVTSTPDASIVTQIAPPYQHIAIASDTADADAIEVSVVSNIHPGGEPLKVSFAPSLIASVSPIRIQGWGLDTADIKVHTVGPYDGRERPIAIAADAGVLVKTDASLSTNGIASAVIRSSSIGRGVITVSANGFPDATANIDFVFPAAFIIAALLGGLVGSVINVFTAGRGRGANAARKIGLGVLCGVIVFGLYALGVNVIQFTLPPRAGEVLVFVVAALGAIGGTKLLKGPASQ